MSTFKLKPQDETTVADVHKVSILGCEIDWHQEIKDYLKDPFGKKVPAKVRLAATKYFLLGNKLYRKDPQGLLLGCVNAKKVLTILAEVHHGLYGSHQSGLKMRWLIHRMGFYWPSIKGDCLQYAKGCKQCQRFKPISRAPAIELHQIIKPWPFRGWAIDAIGAIKPPSSGHHEYILIATDYFTKWIEV